MLKKTIIKISFIVVFAIVFFLIKENYGDSNFFKASFYDILSTSAIVILLYIVTDSKNEEQKAKETAEKIIDKIQEIINETSAYELKNRDIKDILLRNRRISNKLDALENLKSHLDKENNKSLRIAFEAYEKKISDNRNNVEIISPEELRQYLNNMDSKLDRIRISLYHKIK